MSDQIQIRWSSFSKRPYEESLAALKKFDPPPATKLTITVKEALPFTAISRVKAICEKRNATLTTKEKMVGMLPSTGIAALAELFQTHEIEAKSGFKVEGENLTAATINQIKSVADQYEAVIDVLLTATQGDTNSMQLQLFAPPAPAEPEPTAGDDPPRIGEGDPDFDAPTPSPNGLSEHTPDPAFAEAATN